MYTIVPSHWYWVKNARITLRYFQRHKDFLLIFSPLYGALHLTSCEKDNLLFYHITHMLDRLSVFKIKHIKLSSVDINLRVENKQTVGQTGWETLRVIAGLQGLSGWWIALNLKASLIPYMLELCLETRLNAVSRIDKWWFPTSSF